MRLDYLDLHVHALQQQQLLLFFFKISSRDRTIEPAVLFEQCHVGDVNWALRNNQRLPIYVQAAVTVVACPFPYLYPVGWITVIMRIWIRDILFGALNAPCPSSIYTPF